MPEKPTDDWTLTEAARLLEVPQHRLIYLCEKDVVTPDVQDAGGRGSSRRFSSRNLLEFAVALRLRDMELPAGIIGGVLHVLRAFGKTVTAEMPGFRLPDSLREAKAPDLRVVISDGQRLFFTLRVGRASPRVFGGIDLSDSAAASPRTLARNLSAAEESVRLVEERQRPLRVGALGVMSCDGEVRVGVGGVDTKRLLVRAERALRLPLHIRIEPIQHDARRSPAGGITYGRDLADAKWLSHRAWTSAEANRAA